MSRGKDGPGGENEIAIIPGDYKLRDHLTKEILRHLVLRVTESLNGLKEERDNVLFSPGWTGEFGDDAVNQKAEMMMEFF
ncbi:hypothetical protein TNCV_5034521 [Trichonephila clavipes]|nr:hypothetical protein TNCV_5034521 [Trichonephila clavipes]